MHNKTWWFDEETGHGVKAELDNYIEFTLTGFNADFTKSTGECTNWAGVDGKNWDTWFYNNYNKDKGVYRNPDAPKDGSNFYRIIPIGKSTWERDYTVTPNTVTFTDAEGKKIVVELLENDYSFVPGYSDKNASGNTRVFPRNARYSENHPYIQCDLTFHSKITSGTSDNWKQIYNEIDKVFYRPRDFFVDVDKVDEVPAEAKTSEDKWVPEFPEEEPEVPEVPATLAGTYKYSQAHTFGGVNGNVAAVSIVEKYTTWYPSVNNMTDDVYVFTATGKDANGNETGTLTFQPGDNGTWDYKIKAPNGTIYDAVDLYGYIGHNNPTTYVYDAVNNTVTFTTDGKQTVARYLPKGDNTFEAYGKTLTVSSTFALDFDMGYTEPREVVADADKYGNFARFYAYARAYVLHLQKQ